MTFRGNLGIISKVIQVGVVVDGKLSQLQSTLDTMPLRYYATLDTMPLLVIPNDFQWEIELTMPP